VNRAFLLGGRLSSENHCKALAVRRPCQVPLIADGSVEDLRVGCPVSGLPGWDPQWLPLFRLSSARTLHGHHDFKHLRSNQGAQSLAQIYERGKVLSRKDLREIRLALIRRRGGGGPLTNFDVANSSFGRCSDAKVLEAPLASRKTYTMDE
jgi:hypothetical protein